MKKLIALVSSLAIIFSFSVGVMAASGDITTVYTPGIDDPADGVFTTTVNVPVGDQATLLAFKGDKLLLAETDIEFIDQVKADATTVFTYKMKSKVAENQDYTIKVGGSDLASPFQEAITPIKGQVSTSFKITGTVNNLAGSVGDDDFDALWGTYVSLRVAPYDELVTGTESIMIAVPMESMSGTFVIPNVAPGTYIVQIDRLGYLPRCMKVIVSDKDINLDTTVFDGGTAVFGTTTLFGGEFEVDGNIIGDDFGIMLGAFNSMMGESKYREDCDLIPDGNVLGDDFGVILTGFNKVVDTAYLGSTRAFQ